MQYLNTDSEGNVLSGSIVRHIDRLLEILNDKNSV